MTSPVTGIRIAAKSSSTRPSSQLASRPIALAAPSRSTYQVSMSGKRGKMIENPTMSRNTVKKIKPRTFGFLSLDVDGVGSIVGVGSMALVLHAAPGTTYRPSGNPGEVHGAGLR